MPQVSVLMPVYNHEAFVGQAIESILNQTFSDFELVIVDDGSKDGSAGVIRAYQQRDERIRFYQFPHNLGEARARNRTVSESSGDYITFLDADDQCLPERLEKQLEFLRSNPGIGAVGTAGFLVDVNLKHLAVDKSPAHPALIAFSPFIGGEMFINASVMLRREFVLAVGEYDPSMRYGADSDFFLRVMGLTRCANIQEPLYVYRRHNRDDENVKRFRSMYGEIIHERRQQLVLEYVTHDTAARLYKLRQYGTKLSWLERRAARRDLTRVIDAMIAKNWVDMEDRPLLVATMNRRLEQTTPRRWQMLCHWVRHRFGSWLGSDFPAV